MWRGGRGVRRALARLLCVLRRAVTRPLVGWGRCGGHAEGALSLIRFLPLLRTGGGENGERASEQRARARGLRHGVAGRGGGGDGGGCSLVELAHCGRAPTSLAASCAPPATDGRTKPQQAGRQAPLRDSTAWRPWTVVTAAWLALVGEQRHGNTLEMHEAGRGASEWHVAVAAAPVWRHGGVACVWSGAPRLVCTVRGACGWPFAVCSLFCRRASACSLLGRGRPWHPMACRCCSPAHRPRVGCSGTRACAACDLMYLRWCKGRLDEKMIC